MDTSRLDPLYTAAETRALDNCAINSHNLPGITLMARAARAAFDCLLESWPNPPQVQVLCGTGNNGGDGYLIADLAHKRGIPTVVFQVGDAGKIRGDALLAREQALANGVPVEVFSEAAVSSYGVIVDAMLGTGLGGDVRPEYREAIEAVNSTGMPVLAVDIPSGLCADTGRVLGTAIKAAKTITFIGRKRGLYTLDAGDCVGEVCFDSLGVPSEVYGENPGDIFLFELGQALTWLPPRSASAHKGSCGTVLVIGGDHGMAGAVALAGEAALRCGAGLVKVATRAEHVAPLIARTPELMPRGVESGEELKPLLDTADVLVVGPGLGRSSWSEFLFRAALESGRPLVLDADGLNLLAGTKFTAEKHADSEFTVYTPHPGEAARLLGTSTAEIQSDRFAAVRRLQQKFGGVVVLKGNGSLVCDGKQVLLSASGNPGMASGGMGDVLSGVIGSLLGQGMAAMEATALGVSLHGAAADRAAQQGMRGLLASDLMPQLRELLG